MQQFLLKIRRGETPFYRAIGSAARFFLLNGQLPLPRFLLPLLRVCYWLHFGAAGVFRRIAIFCWSEPLFRSRCEAVGSKLTLRGMPFVLGHTEIFVGNDVCIGPQLNVFSGRFIDHPRLTIGDCVSLGGGCTFSVNDAIAVGEGAVIGDFCRITDNDGHPRGADARSQAGAALDRRDIRPVRIGPGSRIGAGCRIMKGVDIGEGAIVGPGSVVMTNLPPHCFAAGNPAEILVRDLRKAEAATGGASA